MKNIEAIEETWNLKKVIILVTLILGWLLLGAETRPAAAAPTQQSGTISNSFGDPGDAYLDFTLSGADFVETGGNFYEGTYNGGAITLSGTVIVTRAEGFSSWVIVDAWVGDQSLHYPPEGDEGLISSTTFELPFSLSFSPTADDPNGFVDGGVRLDVCAVGGCGTYQIGFQVSVPQTSLPAASALDGSQPEESAIIIPASGNESQVDPNSTSNILLPVIVIVAVGGGGLVFIAGVAAVGVFTWSVLKKRPSAPKARIEPPVAETSSEWSQAAQQADLEAEKYIQQWEAVRTSGDPNDPGYQALQKKYHDYIESQRQQATKARRQAQEIDAREAEYQREVRQQQAYRQHRKAESQFIQRQSERQTRRQGSYDRQVDRQVRQNHRRLEQLKAQQKKARIRRHKELIEGHINVDLAEAEMYNSFGRGFERVSSGLEYVKSGADFVIDTFADINPGAGKLIQTGYKIGAGMGEGVGESMQDPANWFSHLTRGTAKGLLDVGADRLKSGMVNGLPPQLREHVIFRGARQKHDPLRLPSFLELPGRPAALQRGIFNTALTRGTDQVNPVIWAREALKNLIGR